MNKLFSDKNKRGRNLVLILIPLIVLTIVFGVLAYNSAKGVVSSTGDGTSSSYSNSIEEYDYHLRSNATDYQKELFSQLKDELSKSEKDDQKIAVLIAKNFIADFYTWSNKSGTTDVGGMYYVYSPNRRSILFLSRRYVYQHLNEYIEQYGQENLLEVESIEEPEKVEKSNFDFYGTSSTSFDDYTFRLNWKYKTKTGGFDTSNYATTSNFHVYKNADGRFEIIDIGG